MSILPKIARLILGLRYQVTLEGEELIKKYKDTSILFLANHPATIDPVIVLSYLEPYAELQPMAAQKFFKNRFIYYFLKKLKALPVPEFESGNNEYKAYKVKELTEQIKKSLKNKAKVLLYPAGHLSDTPHEKLGGATLAFDLKDTPKKIIGIATSGLYGSIFSRYFEGTTAPFMKMLFKGLKIVLLNGVFFVPKKKVVLKLFEVDAAIRSLDDKLEFNKALEQAFNERIQLEPSLIGYGVCKAPGKVKKNGIKNYKIDPKIAADLLQIAQKVLKRAVTLDSHLSYDIGMDSLELAEILALIEQKYRIRIDHFPETLLELGALLEQSPSKTLPKIEKSSSREPLRVELPVARNLLEAFYKQCRRSKHRRMAQDQTLGEVSYQKAALIIDLLSKKIQELAGEHIGIMLPSSIMAYLLMFATIKAKKKPVMLNWTGGYNCLDFGITHLNIEHILSSEKFLEKAFNIDLREHFAKITNLEALKSCVNLFDKCRGFFNCLFLSGLESSAHHAFDLVDTAVILFTSGSESMPKAVPLTHENILANISSLLKTDLVKDHDKFLATLPPFHSFGSVISGFLPLVSGLDTLYMPDPTDSMALCYAFEKSKASLFCSAPSFLKQMLIFSNEHDLDSLRLAVVGAEKLHDSVKKLFQNKCPKACLLEGYGITECSPVVTLQTSPLTEGVGKPLTGVTLMIVDPESLTPLGFDKVGEILIHGKNVFHGYLGIDKNPFVEIDFKKWYRSGDRGSMTSHHELILQGRFKRFIKISAEMISLGAIEEALEDFIPAKEGLATFAVIADKKTDTMVLVTIHNELDLDDLNNHLRKKGCPKVAKITKIKQIARIPQLATGKIDYRTLDHEVI